MSPDQYRSTYLKDCWDLWYCRLGNPALVTTLVRPARRPRFPTRLEAGGRRAVKAVGPPVDTPNMRQLRELAPLSAELSLRYIAFDANGAAVIDLEQQRPGWFTFSPLGAPAGSSPLDLIAGASHGATVAAFERARRTGHGSTRISLVDDDGQHQIDIFDTTDELGCFVALVMPTGISATAPSRQVEHGTRQGSLGMNVSGGVEWVDPSLIRLLGWAPEAMIGRPALDFIHPDDHENGIVAWIDLLERPGTSTTLRQRFKTVEGEWRWCEVTDWNLLEDPDSGCVRADIVDITREIDALDELQRRETLLDRLSRSLPTGVLYVDTDGATLVSNEQWEALTGSPSEEGLAGLRRQIGRPETLDQALEAAASEGRDVDIDVRFGADGNQTAGRCEFGHLKIRPLIEHGRSMGLLVTVDDRTVVRRHQADLAAQARRDPLTGLLNRLGMEEELRSRLEDEAHDVALAFLDLDRFKSINDTYGHAAGDTYLRRVGEELERHLRPMDRVARIGGDEFIAVIVGAGVGSAAVAFRDRITDALGRLAAELHPDLDLGVSIGVAVSEPGDTLDGLLGRADTEMYGHKRARRHRLGPDRPHV